MLTQTRTVHVHAPNKQDVQRIHRVQLLINWSAQYPTMIPTITTVLACFVFYSAKAWSPSLLNPRFHLSTTTTIVAPLFNIPPPSETNVAEFKEYASKQSPPSSFFELQQDCVRSARLARKDGHKLLEVEFPPLPAAVLEMDDVSAYEVAAANLNLALDFCKGMLAADQDQIAPKKIAILFPDEPELKFGIEKMGGSANPYPGVVMGSIRTVDPEDKRLIKPENFLLNLFGKGSGGIVKPLPDVDMYVCLIASAQELPDIEELHELDPDKTIVMYNLKLDVLRGDLGAPAFPGKDFHDRFLSKVKPIYYLRTRQYSRSTRQPPFIVNYQGCLFRAYPGQYQTLLDTGNGKYRRIVSSDERPALGLFKQQLTDSLKEQGIIEEEGKTLSFLRTGYKTTTWWEEDRENASDAWKT
ncbi:hypothetical protein ACA910_014086 [Epithemia clementina (nom. ined.)]